MKRIACIIVTYTLFSTFPSPSLLPSFPLQEAEARRAAAAASDKRDADALKQLQLKEKEAEDLMTKAAHDAAAAVIAAEKARRNFWQFSNLLCSFDQLFFLH